MEVFFLGTGGGRVNLIKQVRGTGGFRISSRSADIHVDPGPGALVHSVRSRLDLLSLDAIIVTHNHVDHMSDAMALIEGMTHYGLKRRGILIGSGHTLSGDESGDRGVSLYHQSKVTIAHIAEGGQKRTFETEKGEFILETVKVRHEEPSAFGFKIHMDGKIVGYTSDTEYMESLGRDFSGCDLLIVNCIKPEPDKYTGHLSSEEVIMILKEARPKAAVITHLGIKMLRMGPAEEAERISKESGVKTTAARDGMKIEA
ncbi:MAG: MBL fold metallo-hydrolase [Candidatus Micrarchaeota archaeon]